MARRKKEFKGFGNPLELARQHLKVDPELRALIPPLKEDELEQLRQNLIQEGCRDPLVVWHDRGQQAYWIIDGHNRHRLCTENQIDFEITLKDFDSKEEAKAWMIENQLGRRNLTPEQMSYLRGKQYENEKSRWGGADRFEPSSQNEDLQAGTQKTSQRLASAHNVSPNTILRDEQFARGLDVLARAGGQALKERILAGHDKVKKGEIQRLARLWGQAESLRIHTLEDLRQVLANAARPAPKTTDEAASSFDYVQAWQRLRPYLNALAPDRVQQPEEQLRAVRQLQEQLQDLEAQIRQQMTDATNT